VPMPAITLRPAHGIKVTLVKRKQSQSAVRAG
jgi:hypothetical protein